MVERRYAKGISLLRLPVMPLVSMVQFLFMTGPFKTVAEVIDQLPEPIETDRTAYENPRALLMEYSDILSRFEQLKTGDFPAIDVVDEQNTPVDALTAATALIHQQVLTREMERINSVLCAPCGCTLCCVGPEGNMEQEFFEIPLAGSELDLFAAVPRHESPESLSRSAYDDDELLCSGKPFYTITGPGLFHWRRGWSLILPKATRCPNLDGATGHCRVYKDRPLVCRRPQIFPYMLEPVEEEMENVQSYRIRQALLAIVDCPYVRDVQNDVAEYAAASDLLLVLKENKA